MKMVNMIDGRRPKGFTVIEAMIVVAIIAIIAAIAVPAFTKKTTPSGQPAYEGWTFVVEAPYGRLYMKHLPEKHITVYWNTHNGNMQVVNDRD